MSDHHHHAPGDDLTLARTALEIGDHGHAAFHVACRLAEDARDAEALEVADRVLRSAPDPTGLCKPEPNMYFGLVGFHARAQWHAGHRDTAVRLLGNVIAAAPNAGYATWLAGWVREVDPVLAADGIDRAAKGVPHADDTGKAELIAAAEAASTVHAANDIAASCHVRVLRACGRVPEALERAAALDARLHTYMTGVVLATTRRVAGDLDGAIAQLRDVAARFPDDNACLLDLGDNLLDLRRYGEAAEAYETVTAREPHHEWARPSRLYARYCETGDAAPRDELEDLAQVDGARRAKDLARSISPYVGFLPSRTEAILKIGEQLRAEPPSSVLQCAQSSLEAPSALAAVQRMLAAHGGGLDVTAELPDPDPRVPRGAVEFATWRYDGIRAEPAMPPPPATVCEALAAFADTRFDGPGWCERAGEIAASPEDVIAAMVHGCGEAPSWSSPLHWPWRCQIAGALVLARLEEPVRMRALLSLIDGPVDWLATAALVALTRLCEREPALVPAVTAILERCAALPVTPVHHQCLIEPAIELLAQLPGASPQQRAARRAARAALR